VSAAKGWRTKIVIQGSPEDEEMQGSPAQAGQTVFYTRSFPVVDASGNITDDESEVTVKKNGAALNTSEYTLTGATGKIELAAGASDGDVLACSYSTRYALAYGRSGEVTVDGGLEEIYVLNQRTPKEALEGAVKIEGALERFFISRDWVGKVVPDPDGDAGQAAFYVYLYPLGETTGKPCFTVGGVKFGPWTLSVPDPDTPITESLSWKGTSITPGTVS